MNRSGPQPDVRFCPICQGQLHNIPREEMSSPGYTRADGTVAPDTHTYQCDRCHVRFEINQQR